MKRLLLLLMMFVCTACTALPAEERAFAVALCIEKQEGTWRVWARIPAYKADGEYLSISGEGEHVQSAIADMNSNAPMQIPLSQLRLLILSDSLSGQELKQLFDMLSGMYEVRQQCAVAMTDESAEAVAEALTPEAGTRLSKAIDVMLEARLNQGAIPQAVLADILRMGGMQSPLLMRLVLREGRVDLSGAYPLSLTGEVLTPVSSEETALLSCLRGDVKAVALPLDKGMIRIRAGRAKIVLTEHGGLARITLTAQAVEAAEERHAQEQRLAAACADLLGRLSRAGCDALGLGRKEALQGNWGTVWNGAQWQQKLCGLQWEVAVKITPPV